MLLVSLLATASGPEPDRRQKPSADVRTIEIVGTDDMKFDVTEIAARPGERIRIRLRSEGKIPKIVMAHNVVVLKPGTNVDAFNAAASQARATGFIPPLKKTEVVAATTLAGNGETVEVIFIVPRARGKYPYLCSFPGHFGAGMKGTLLVK